MSFAQAGGLIPQRVLSFVLLHERRRQRREERLCRQWRRRVLHQQHLWQLPSPYTVGTEAAFSEIAAIATGVMYPASKTTMAQITDGASNTYLFGEKYLSPDQYYQGADPQLVVKG